MDWKPNRKRLSDQVAEKIKAMILSGEVAKDTRLPAERVLAEQMGVTRLTLREALKETERSGFTKTRHGAGTYVCDLSKEANLGLLDEILNSGQGLTQREVRSLLEFRRVNFLGFAGMVVQNARPDQIEQLYEIIERERGSFQDVDAIVALDYEFHEKLAEASSNLIYALFMRSVHAAYSYLCYIVFNTVFEQTGTLESVTIAHEAMANSIRDRNASAYREQVDLFITCGDVFVEQSLESKPA